MSLHATWFLLLLLAGARALPGVIRLESADEGMSSWRHALCEFFAIALHFNASVTEPCVAQGRVNPCTMPDAQRLSTLYDLSRIEHEFGLRFISDEAFASAHAAAALLNRTARWSVHMGHPYSPDPSLHRMDWKGLQRTLRNCDVLTLYSFRKFSRCTKALAATVDKLLAALSFAKTHTETVDRFVNQLFDGRPYAAIHWRSEATCRNYTACTAVVLSARERLCARLPHFCRPLGPPVLLISDLTANHSASSWQVMRVFLVSTGQTETAHRAYETLTAPPSGFVKLDSVLHTNEERMSSFRPIWDLLMGVRASVLLTCSDACPESSLCRPAKCARQGNFARHLIELRAETKDTTPAQCW